MSLVPRVLRDVAVLVEPLTIAEKGIAQLWKIQERLPWLRADADPENPGAGKRAVVLGAGPVGLLGAMAFLCRGFQTIVYSRQPKPNRSAELIEPLGATYVSSEETDPHSLAERVGNIDLVYEAVGNASVSFDLLGVLGINGVFIFTGVPALKAPRSVDIDRLMRNMVLKNQVALGTVNAGKQAFEDAIRDLGEFERRWPDAVRSLISARYPIEEHRDLLLANPGGIKNVIKLS